MQFLTGRSLHEVSTGSGTLKPEETNTDEQERTFGSVAGQMRRDEKNSVNADPRRRKWQWVVGGSFAVVLLLFAFFRSQPLPERRVNLLAERTAIPAPSAAPMSTAAVRSAGTDVGAYQQSTEPSLSGAARVST